MNEFDTIEAYFLRLTEGRDEALNLKDDAALLKVADNMLLAVSSDTLNIGTHIFETSSPADIAHKALRTNLSDLAAMGTKPYAYQLSLSFPEKPSKEWLNEFTSALLKDQETYGIFCTGGDTTSSKGVLSVSITVFGTIENGKALKRSHAKQNDLIFTTGHIGDAYIGYKILNGDFTTDDNTYFINTYHRPTPQIELMHTIKEKLNAAIDISDGLIADISHMAKASNLNANLVIPEELFSPQAQKVVKAGHVEISDLITGGDDYQVAFSIPEEHAHEILRQHTHLIKIGTFKAGPPEVTVANTYGKTITYNKKGWTHF